MPMRSRKNSDEPSCASMSRSPLWPAWPPPNFIFTLPGMRSSSSCTTRISSGAMAKKRADAATARPERFMNVIGFSSRTAPAFATSPANFDSWTSDAPSFAASSSANKNPALWRVFAYSRPGLPSPATRRMGVFNVSTRGCQKKKPASFSRASCDAAFWRRAWFPLLLPVVLLAVLLVVFLVDGLFGALVGSLVARSGCFAFHRRGRGRCGLGFCGCCEFFVGFDLRARHDRRGDHGIELAALHDGDARRQLHRRDVQRVADFQRGQIDLDEPRKVLRQAGDVQVRRHVADDRRRQLHGR